MPPDNLLDQFGYETFPAPGDGPTHESRDDLEEQAERSLERGVALCLSGGGIRAAAFHLGTVRRLAELGVLPDVQTVSSVSGGSILSAFLLEKLDPWPVDVVHDFDTTVSQPFREVAGTNLRRGLALGLLKGRSFVESMEKTYGERISGRRLSELPDRPRFVFNATDLGFGVNWVFERERVGSYRAGYLEPRDGGEWTVARAVAASSCFPPIFRPMRLSFSEEELKGAKQKSDRYRELIRRIRLTDGGIYDNMGLQPVLSERAPVVLVSDGGAPFTRRAPTNLWGEAMRYHGVLLGQIGSLRRSGLFGSFGRETFGGAYWGIGSAVERYETTETGPFEGYSKRLAGSVIARMRTDLDAFTEAEVAVLENHGYTLAEAALQRHAPEVVGRDVLPFAWPHPQWRDEARAEKALSQSHRRKYFF
jgi:NTE family protein